MVQAKAELECIITEKEHQMNLIREKLNTKSTEKTTKQEKQEKEENQDKKLENTIHEELIGKLNEPMKSETISNELNNILIFDAKDPNRPRFTLNELQKVLMEKNQLTVKLDQTKDELDQLRRQ